MAGKKGVQTPRVYVETSVWGMTLPGQPRALREPTQQLLNQCRAGRFVVFVSEIVLQENDRAESDDARRMLREMNRVAPVVLEQGAESEELAEAYIQAGVVPPKKRDDARHVAIATVARLDLLVSWNQRHLTNHRKRQLYNAVNQLAGFEHGPVICTPFEVSP